jgi:general L-amino acid transport system substrate-binding protein
VDLLVRNTSWTLTREASLGLLMAWINFHDGTAFVVRSDAGVSSARQLDGATICLLQGTSTELDVAEWFRANNLRFTPVLFGGVSETQAAFLANRCDAWANDASYIAAFRASQPNASLALLPSASAASRWAPWCGRATTAGLTWCAGPAPPSWPPSRRA